jgi:hypothetical protein
LPSIRTVSASSENVSVLSKTAIHTISGFGWPSTFLVPYAMLVPIRLVGPVLTECPRSLVK